MRVRLSIVVFLFVECIGESLYILEKEHAGTHQIDELYVREDQMVAHIVFNTFPRHRKSLTGRSASHQIDFALQGFQQVLIFLKHLVYIVIGLRKPVGPVEVFFVVNKVVFQCFEGERILFNGKKALPTSKVQAEGETPTARKQIYTRRFCHIYLKYKVNEIVSFLLYLLLYFFIM